MYAWSFIVDSINYRGWYKTINECLESVKCQNYTNEKFVYIGEKADHSTKNHIIGIRSQILDNIKRYDL